MLDPLNRIIASLYGAAFQQPLTGFQDFALAQISQLVPFDSAVWATGINEINQIHAVHLLNLPADLMMRYKMEYVATDYIRARAIAEPGRAFRIEDVMRLDDYYTLPAYTELGREIGIEHAMATAHTDPISGLSELILLWRADRDCPFSDEEREITQTLVPHVVAGWQHRQLVAMGSLSAGVQEVETDQSRAHAIVDTSGLIYAVIGNFGDLFSKAVPGWNGPHLPDFVVEAINTGNVELKIGHYHILFSRAELRTIVVIAPQAKMDTLSAGELRAVRLYAGGASNKEIAAELNLSTHTVRNQISASYRKLGVHSKIELVIALNGQL